MSNQPTILLAGGGTGGHLYPGLAVAETLRTLRPDVRCIFLCTKREIDQVILGPAGFEFIPQPISPMVRSISGLLRFWQGWRETMDLLRGVLKEKEPAAVLGLGGYAAGAAVKLAAGKKIPTVILNPDVIPGRANQYLLRYTQAMCCQFARTADYLSSSGRDKVKVTGCPIRADIVNRPAREVAVARLELDAGLKTLVITGASLGAKTVNEAVLTALQQMLQQGVTLQGWQVLHLAGREHADSVRREYRDLAPGISARVIDFTPAMADIWAVADVCISRSGASSCAELTACGIPSLLMPYPFHKDMHQRANAKVLSEAEAAVLIDDDKDRRKNAGKLMPALEPLLHDSGRRETMAEAARKLGNPNAAQAVAEIVMELAVGN